MKKIFFVFLSSLFFFSLFAFSASAEEVDFWQEFKDILPSGSNFENQEDVISGVGIEAFLSEILTAFEGGKNEFLSFLSLVLGVVLLIASAETFGLGSESKFKREIDIGIVTISAILIFNAIRPVVFSVKDGISEMGGFFSSLTPILTAISASGGNLNSAGVQAFNMNITCSVIGYLSSSLLMPLSFMMFALVLADGVGGGRAAVLARGIKNTFMWVVGICSAVLIGMFSLQSLIATASDGAYLRSAKYAISGSIPIVGGTVSSALGALAGGLSYAKSTVGVASVGVIITMSLSVLLLLLLYRAALSAAVMILEFVGSNIGVKMFGAFKGAFDALVAIFSMTTLVCIFEIVVFIKSGVDIFG